MLQSHQTGDDKRHKWLFRGSWLYDNSNSYTVTQQTRNAGLILNIESTSGERLEIFEKELDLNPRAHNVSRIVIHR